MSERKLHVGNLNDPLVVRLADPSWCQRLDLKLVAEDFLCITALFDTIRRAAAD